MNVFRQGNSMKAAFQSALFGFEIQQQQQQQRQRHGYDMYIFVRSDTLLLSPIDIPCSGLGDRDIHIPSWHSFGGDNDRFALTGPTAAIVYVAAKTNVFKEMILNPGEALRTMEQKGRTGWEGKLGNPEKMLRLWMDENDALNVTRGPNNWVQLMRVRSGGVFHKGDMNFFRVRQHHVRDMKL